MAASRLADVLAGLPRAYWFLWAGMLVNRLGGFVLPMLMIYLTTQRGASLVEAGAIVAAYGFGALGGNALGGVLADRIGRRKTLLISLGSSAALMLLVSISSTSSQLAVSVGLLGLAGAMHQPSASALIADLVEPQHRIKAFAYYYFAANLGFSLAALVGGAMAASHFSLLFVLDALTTLAFAVIVWLAVPETKSVASQNTAGSLFTPFGDRRFVPFLVLSAVGAFVLMQRSIMLPVDMTAKHLTTRDFGIAIAVNGLLVVLLQPLVSSWVVRGTRASWLGFASVLLGVGFGLTSWATTLPLYAFTVMVWTLAEVIFAPINSSFVADLAPPHLRGRYQAAFSLAWSLAMMLAPVLSPLLVDLTSLRAFWLLCLLLGLITGVGHVVFVRRSEHLLRTSAGP